MVENFFNLYNARPFISWKAKLHPESKIKPFTLPLDAKEITLAENSPTTKPYITAHELSDYRRRKFSLLMLPDISLPIDALIKKEVFEDVRVSLQGTYGSR